jgi:hypothetical protein
MSASCQERTRSFVRRRATGCSVGTSWLAYKESEVPNFELLRLLRVLADGAAEQRSYRQPGAARVGADTLLLIPL